MCFWDNHKVHKFSCLKMFVVTFILEREVAVRGVDFINFDGTWKSGTFGHLLPRSVILHIVAILQPNEDQVDDFCALDGNSNSYVLYQVNL